MLAVQGGVFLYERAFPALLKKGYALYNPVCSGAFPPASPPCHHYGQGCRSFLPKICAPRYARVGTKGIYGGTAHNFGTENLRPRYRMVARKFSCKISKKQLAAFNIAMSNKQRRFFKDLHTSGDNFLPICSNLVSKYSYIQKYQSRKKCAATLICRNFLHQLSEIFVQSIQQVPRLVEQLHRRLHDEVVGLQHIVFGV